MTLARTPIGSRTMGSTRLCSPMPRTRPVTSALGASGQKAQPPSCSCIEAASAPGAILDTRGEVADNRLPGGPVRLGHVKSSRHSDRPSQALQPFFSRLGG